jgi:arsenate reductase
MKNRRKILFLCTGNSCRSQMAEGWARHLKSDVIEAYSAGIDPTKINPRAIAVMREAGVDISIQSAKHIDRFVSIDFDYVVTLCDDARESCPVFGGKAGLLHRSFEDPSLAKGREEEIMAAFRKSRDDIRAFIETMPESL